MSYHDRSFDPQERHALQSAEREAKWHPRSLLQQLGFQLGQSVLDLGCGTGFWTLPLAEIVGVVGKVWALDVSPEMLEALVERKPPTQVQPLLSELPRIDLPEASVDSIWGAFVIHEVEPLEDLIVEMQRVLRPGGYLAILDWRPDAAHDAGPPFAHRLASDAIIRHLQAAGFQQVSQTWQNEDAYLVEANCYGEKGSGE